MNAPYTGFDLHNLACPRCGAPRMDVADDKRVICAQCGAEYFRADSLCPECGHINAPRTEYCVRCDTPIARQCPTCGQRNWAGASHCEHCQHSLDPIEEMSTRWAHRTRERLTEQMSGAAEIKRQEATAAEARSQALWEIERRRQEHVQRDLERQRRQERQVIIIAAVGAGLLVLLLLIVVALQVIR